MSRRFALAIPKAVRHLRRVDPTLREIIKRVGPYTMRLERNRFAALVWSIISQQISIKAAASIRKRLANRLTPARLSPQALLDISFDDLRTCGLSNAKTRYIHDLAGHVASASVNLPRIHRADDEAVIQELIKVKGIGRWTAEMFLIFCLGRLDVLPVDDLGLRVGVQRMEGLAELPAKEDVAARGAIWTPYRSVATWYLWQSLKVAKENP